MRYLLTYFLLVSAVTGNDKVGPVVLCGGGSFPKEAVTWAKENSKSDRCLVISRYKDFSKWSQDFDNIICCTPLELTDSILENVDIVLISGGDQWKYLCELDGKLLTKAHKRGVCIMGTSAGAMIMGSDYFSAENGTINTWEALADEHVCLGKNFIDIDYLKDTIVEVHYTERDRQDRLEVFMKKSGVNRGIGLDENTTYCINESGSFVFGPGNVKIILSQKE